MTDDGSRSDSDPVAVVLARDGGSYRVMLGTTERSAIVRGTTRRDGERVVAGDRVRLDPETLSEEMLAIVAVEPRSSLLARRIPDGRGKRPVAANVDQVMVVTAAADPPPILQLLDRLLVVAAANEIAAVVVVNKVDLGSADPIIDHLAASNYPILQTSTSTMTGIDVLRAGLIGKETVFAGASGVGKSSLLNAIVPGLGLRIGAISEKVRRGKHTTTTATMLPIGDQGFVVDTPGFSDVGLWQVDREDLGGLFPEIAELVNGCRFGDCQHRREPDCAVTDAVAAGSIPATRHQSYLALYDELEALPESWE